MCNENYGGIYTTDYKNEFISLTDIARYRSIDPRITIHNWLRSRDIVEFLGLWEELHNPDFKRVEFDTFKTDAGTNAFVFSIKDWTEQLLAVQQMTTLSSLELSNLPEIEHIVTDERTMHR